MSDQEQPALEFWGILELMGHVRTAGRISEEEHFGAKLGRIDVPTKGGFITQYFGGGSVYRLTVTDEATARAVALANAPQPVSRFELPALMDAVPAPQESDLDDEDLPY